MTERIDLFRRQRDREDVEFIDAALESEFRRIVLADDEASAELDSDRHHGGVQGNIER